MLSEAILEPDLARDDWSEARTRMRFVHDAVERDVLGALDGALQQSADNDEVAGVIRRRVAVVLGEAAAPVYARGRAVHESRARRATGHVRSGHDAGGGRSG